MRMRGWLSGILAVLVLLPCVAAAGIDRGFLDVLLRQRSRCGDEPELLCAVDLVRRWLTDRGVFCTIETNEVGRVALYAATSQGKVHDYLFVSHLDVVAAPDGLFEPRYEGDRVFARGACDTKGNVVVMCQVLADLVGRASIGMFLATDEDGGGRGTCTPRIMIDRGYVPRKMVIVGDSAGEEPGQLFTAEKGHAFFTLVAHGMGGHSSRPWALDNPIPKLCEGYLRFAREWDAGADLAETWRTVVSPTQLVGSEAGNIVPDEAKMILSCRYTTRKDYERALTTLRRTTGLEVIASEPVMKPVENRPDDPEIAKLFAAMARDLPGGIREGRMSGATHAAFYAGRGLPVVIFASTGGGAHSDREWGSLKSLDDYADFFTAYFTKRHEEGICSGLNVGVSDQCPVGRASEFYLSALRAAGHEASYIPRCADTNALRETVRKFDLVLFTGGEDVDPVRYGEKPSPKLGRLNPNRDEYDFALFAACVAERKPIFGICRGLQAMNVFFGGTLYQDIGTEYRRPADTPEVRHGGMNFFRGATNPPAHDLLVVPGSRLGKAIGCAPMKVNSHHHQGVKKLAPGFRVTARSADGFVEAIESTNYPAAAVQFHPEQTVHYQPKTGFVLDRHLKLLQELMPIVGP